MRSTCRMSLGHETAPVLLAHPDELALDEDPTRVGVLEEVDAAEQGALARPARPQDGEHVVVFGAKRNALQHLEGEPKLFCMSSTYEGGFAVGGPPRLMPT